MTEFCFDSIKTKKKIKTCKRKKLMWKEKIEIDHMRGELLILSELQRGLNVKGRACKTLKRR